MAGSLLMSRRPQPGRRAVARWAALLMLVGAGTVEPAHAAAAAEPASKVSGSVPESYQRSDEVSAWLASTATNHEILITDATTATSLTYARPDGTTRTEITTTPVRVKQAGGAWADVDYNLTAVDGGFAPKVSPVDVVFSAGGSGPAVSLDHGSRSADLLWAKSLPAPTIDGPNAFYQLTDNEQLVLTATSDGFEQSLKLLAPPATAPKLRLGFDMTGLTMVANDNGGYDFVQTRDGKATSTVVLTMPKPKMYSSLVVEEERTQVQSLPVTLSADDDGTQYVDLSVGMAFLTDPATVYPVWIDPAVSSVSRYGDTYVTQADSDSHWSDSEIRIGASTSGNIRRSLVRFNTANSVPKGAHVTSAALKLWNFYSGTCTARAMNAYPITADFSTVTWATQPSYTTSYGASASFANGNEDIGCPNAAGSLNVAGMVQAWVSGTIADYGMLLKATNETDTTYAKYFCSMNVDATAVTSCTTTARYPTLSVVYNTYPGTPAGVTFSPKVLGTVTDTYTKAAKIFSTSLTPTFAAKVTNADGGKVSLQVKLSRDLNFTGEGTGEIATYTSAATTPGSTAKVTVPAGVLTNGSHVMYQMRSRVTNGAGGYDYSAWTPASLASTSTTKLQLNTDAPAAPTVSCGAYPAGTWSTQAAATTTCSIDTTAADGAGYYWGLDDPATPNLANDTSNTGAAVTATVPTTPGWHTLYARSRDTALHLSSGATAYTFGVGPGGVLSPDTHASTAKAVALSASANSALTQVTYQWAAGTTSATWSDLPLADVTPNGSPTPVSGWPLTGVSSGNLTTFAGYNWNVASTLAAAGQPDGALRIRAKFTTATGAASYSTERIFILAATTFGQNAATEDLGPGMVSLTTGDFQVGAADAAVGGLSIGRTATSLAPAAASTGATGIFGAGWRAATPGSEAGLGDSELIDNSAVGSMTLQASDGTESVYVKQPSGSYLGIGNADDGSALIKSTSIKNPADASDTTAYTGWQLTDIDGVVTTWVKSGSAWLVKWIDQAGDEGETTYARDSNGRVTTILAPTPVGVTCTTSSFTSPGCTALRVTYASATSATGTEESAWGTYAGLVSGMSWTGYDPATAAMTTKQVAAYLYDSTGHLRVSWDPRLAIPLKTRYAYDTAGRIATVSPPGQNPWVLRYDTTGRLADVSRTDPAHGTATQAIVYDLPVSGNGGAPDVSGPATATWGQVSDLAYSGAATFPSSHVPPANPTTHAYTAGTGDWPYAHITYTDVNGRVVNTAAYGAGNWQITSDRYDDGGNVTWSLSAGNRAQALTPNADTDPFVASQTSSAARADLLATITTYSSDGVDLLSSLGSAHPAQLSNGSTASVRVQTTNTYDDGAPTTDAYHLVTKVVGTPIALDGTTVPADETETTVYGFDPIDGAGRTADTSGWTHMVPTTETTWMGATASSNDLTTKFRFDSSGRVVEERKPGGAATDANTIVTTYYTTATNATYPACGGKPYWAGLKCRTGAGGGPPVPSIIYTYDLYGQVATIAETSGSVVRTTTTRYDEAGRSINTSISVAGLPTSTAVQATSLGFDPATGELLTTTQGSTVITSTYDALGRRMSYTDANGVKTTYTYDIDGDITALDDGKSVTTYTYDSNIEHRGVVTAINAGFGVLSTFSGDYDAAGNLSKQTYPNGMTAAYAYDNLGNATALTYELPAVPGGSAASLTFSTANDATGSTVRSQSPLSVQEYVYDNEGRLTSVHDTIDGACTTRVYGFSQQSDRTSLATYGADDDGNCQKTTATSTVTSTYDTANRVTNAGYAYDPLGRTITVPAVSLASGTDPLSVAYYDTDMAARLTQGAAAKAFTIDPAGRYRSVTDTTDGAEKKRVLHHYAATSDSPSWTETSTDGGATNTWQRNVAGMDGALAAIQKSSGDVDLQITNLHGDVVATVLNHTPTTDDISGAATTSYFETTEYGASRDGAVTRPYGWLGGAQRSSDALASIVLTGVRLYNPAGGRFLQRDPVLGGSANDYDYCSGDPVNCQDASGKSSEVTYKKSKMNPAEVKRCKKRVAECSTYLSVGKQVLDRVAKVFKGQNHTNGRRNAYRHCIWQGLLTYWLGESRAKAWAKAHENGATGDDHDADMFNNISGRNIGKESQKYWGQEQGGKKAWKYICKWCWDVLRRGYLDTSSPRE
ncbi:hypothetical protein ADL15_44850 [Actinoplanes awajinensis subsp. mycoplanecinus]|uniref:Uncharacterized protein n=2 Tax=Actinoplanes awajinensis TaxID=135946 RepID=A0A117MLG9_9ACTN|nr:hypothetical protein ADL15_44850 [Actinoplanes awajinensis subsp. mycoplanecinus]